MRKRPAARRHASESRLEKAAWRTKAAGNPAVFASDSYGQLTPESIRLPKTLLS
jgi:hypothetical protein